MITIITAERSCHEDHPSGRWRATYSPWAFLVRTRDGITAVAGQCCNARLRRGRRSLRYRHYLVIPRSRHNPKILGIDDAEIVGDRITEVRPIPRNFFTQETERRIGELGASRVGFIVRDMLVHHAP